MDARNSLFNEFLNLLCGITDPDIELLLDIVSTTI
jgi:hypothetical protein